MDDIVGLLDGVQALPLRYLDYAAAEWCMRAVLVCVVLRSVLATFRMWEIQYTGVSWVVHLRSHALQVKSCFMIFLSVGG